MRKSKKEAAETRQRILKAAAAKFRQNGIGGTGLADLMAAAGLTHGGFYKHFESKEQVVAESITLATESTVSTMRQTLSASPGPRGLNAVISEYLSPEHRDDPSGGCPLVSLGGEVPRGGDA